MATAPFQRTKPTMLERLLDVIKLIVMSPTGIRVQIHSIIVTASVALSLATQATVGIAPGIAAYAWAWALVAFVVAVLQLLALRVRSERVIQIAAVVAAMFFFGIAAGTAAHDPTSWVVYMFAALGCWSGIPPLRPLCE